ncbi:HupE/UreJ family protein [Thiothrix subterranea]|uniref:HupE/UreJ family protein n=1 Tax=Thiothrix subterranea TaxID=2735563 RepID=A0AA51QZY9_9GAMM|nr:HupE/UreJ family protein [Thiothrix subterranea]MDQ5770522.1 HupE/UreJ family protein [Thiothrix subterranea]WML87472.1 HupE/UreJ family protein [Thiothrix subterranea]
MQVVKTFLWMCALLLGFMSLAEAHPASASAISLRLNDTSVALDIQMPLDQLQMALPDVIFDNQQPIRRELRDVFRQYLSRHLALRTPQQQAFTWQIASLAYGMVDNAPNLLVSIKAQPPAATTVGAFQLEYDAILHQVVSHKVYVMVSTDFKAGIFPEQPQTVDIIRYQHSTVQVERVAIGWWQQFGAMAVHGVQHILEGTDHLLFLLCLLLPAPLLIQGQRWAGQASQRESVFSIVKIVTAFTVGHSLTLALATLGIVPVPADLVEILVAASIVIAALHALRPLFGNHAARIAIAFGLVHGLAFASVLTGLGLDVGDTVLALLAFNLGIEAMQLLLIGLVMPWLILMAQRESFYRYVRLLGAWFSLIAAVLWILERAWGVTNPLMG